MAWRRNRSHHKEEWEHEQHPSLGHNDLQPRLGGQKKDLVQAEFVAYDSERAIRSFWLMQAMERRSFFPSSYDHLWIEVE